MDKKIKIYLGVGAALLGMAAVQPTIFSKNIDAKILSLSENDINYDYSPYSEKSIKEYMKLIESKMAKDSNHDVLYYLMQLEVKELTSFGDKEISPLNLMQKRLAYGASSGGLFANQYSSLLEEINVDIQREEDIRAMEYYNKKNAEKKELIEFREEQEQWARNFLKIVNGGVKREEWGHRNFSVKNINIYDYFKDGKYSAPVRNPNYDRINTTYGKYHYGIDLKMDENEEVLSIANNARVTVDENSLDLHLDSGAVVHYKNLKTSLVNGDVVNKGDVIGTYVQADDNFKGLFVGLSKGKKDYAVEWLVAPLPFIPNGRMSMPLYIQFDPSWGGTLYGGGTIGNSGCGPSSLSMAISYLKDEIITPADIGNKVGGSWNPYASGGHGSSWSLIDEVPAMYGLKSRRIKRSEIIDELRKNHPVVAIMGPGEFTKGGHYITLSGVTEDGRIYVNDSADTEWVRHFDMDFALSLITSETRGCFWAISK